MPKNNILYERIKAEILSNFVKNEQNVADFQHDETWYSPIWGVDMIDHLIDDIFVLVQKEIANARD